MDEFEGVVRTARDEELRLLALRRAEEDRQSSRTNTLLILEIVLGALIAAGSGWSVQRDSSRRRLAEEATRESEERFRTLANNISQLAWMTDEKGSIFWYNQRWYDYTGTTVEEMAGWGWQTVHHPEHVQRVVDEFSRCFAAGEEWEDTFPLRGARRQLSMVSLARGSDSRCERKGAALVRHEYGHQRPQAPGRGAVRREGTCACHTGKHRRRRGLHGYSGNISFLNVVAEKNDRLVVEGSDWTADGEACFELWTPRREQPLRTRWTWRSQKTAPERYRRTAYLFGVTASKRSIEDSVAPIHDRNGQVTGAVIVFRDVSAARAMAQQMTHSARHDFLTGLPNRMLLNDRIDQALISAARHEKKAALLFLDLDGFKHINDSLGHAVGDKLLQSIATRLRTVCAGRTPSADREGMNSSSSFQKWNDPKTLRFWRRGCYRVWQPLI